ncbi:hypothetical protein COOONC_22542, partial [Cooperia oncophora]
MQQSVQLAPSKWTYGLGDWSNGPEAVASFGEAQSASFAHIFQGAKAAKRLIHARIPASRTDAVILGQPLTFRNGRTAQNRFLKAALTERISTWDAKNPSKRGVPTQELINIYDKWAHGRFGMILTGNVCVEPNHLESVGNVVFSKENDFSSTQGNDGEIGSNDETGRSAGRQTQEAVNLHPFSCSDIGIKSKTVPLRFGTPIALTEAQVKTEVVDRFVYAAKFAHDH